MNRFRNLLWAGSKCVGADALRALSNASSVLCERHFSFLFVAGGLRDWARAVGSVYAFLPTADPHANFDMNRKARRAARKHEPGFDNDGLVDQASDLSVFAKTLIADGDFGAALLPVSRLLDLSPTAEAKEMFLICMSSVQFESATPELHATLIRAVTEPWGSGNDLSKIVCPIIKLDPNIAADLASLRADPAAQLLPRSITAAAKNRLLLAALESLALRDAELELYLTECRAALLNDAVSPKMHGNLPPLAFTAALARQCFNNEYVFA